MQKFKFITGQFSTGKEYICKYYKNEIKIKSDTENGEIVFSCENDKIFHSDSKFYIVDDLGKKIKCVEAIIIENDKHGENLSPSIFIPTNDNAVDRSLIEKAMTNLKKYLYIMDTKQPMVSISYLCANVGENVVKISPKSHVYHVSSTISMPVVDNNIETAVDNTISAINKDFMSKLNSISDAEYFKTFNIFDRIKKWTFGQNYTKKYKVNSDKLVKLLTKHSRKIAARTGYPASHCFVSASVASLLIDKVFDQNVVVKDMKKLPYFVGRVENIDVYVDPTLDYNDGKILLYKKSENLIPSLSLVYYNSLLMESKDANGQIYSTIRTRCLVVTPNTCENYVQKFYIKVK